MGHFKLGFTVGLGAGFVLGSRAGRESYDRIVEKWNEFTGRPEVQRVADKASQTFDRGVQKASDTVSEKLDKVDERAGTEPGRVNTYESAGPGLTGPGGFETATGIRPETTTGLPTDTTAGLPSDATVTGIPPETTTGLPPTPPSGTLP